MKKTTSTRLRTLALSFVVVAMLLLQHDSSSPNNFKFFLAFIIAVGALIVINIDVWRTSSDKSAKNIPLEKSKDKATE